MWKWIIAAALIYGLGAVGYALGPVIGREFRQRAVSRYLDGFTVPSGRGSVNDSLDLGTDSIKVATLPREQAGISEVDKRHNVIHWVPAGPDWCMAGFPLTAGSHTANVFKLGIRARNVPELFVGLRENDGSLYLARIDAGPVWNELRIPLERFRLSPFLTDNNNQLDPGEITAVVLLAHCPPGTGSQESQASVDIDRAGITEMTSPGLRMPVH